jgi:hypothetical protein
MAWCGLHYIKYRRGFMAYNKKAWQRRLAERSDLSTQVVHLTRDADNQKLVDVLFSILSDGKLKGSSTQSGFICGKTPPYARTFSSSRSTAKQIRARRQDIERLASRSRKTTHSEKVLDPSYMTKPQKRSLTFQPISIGE